MADHPVPLGVVKPAKPVSKMTAEERKAFAKSIADMLRARHTEAVKLSAPPVAEQVPEPR